MDENECGKSNKGREQGCGKKPSSKIGPVIYPWAGLVGVREVLKIELPHLAWGRDDQTELQLQGNAAAAWWKQELWPPCMNWKWVTSDPICNLPCRQKEPNTAHKPVTWWDHFRVTDCNVHPIRQRKVGKNRKKIPSTISTHSPQTPRYQDPISWLDTKGITSKLLPSRLNFMLFAHLVLPD
jgi:hypothetical protein